MDQKLCGRFFAMIFYSFGDPNDARTGIRTSLESLLDISRATFTRKSLDGEHYRASGRYLAYLDKTISTADFARSHFLRLHDGTDDAVQTTTVEYWLRTIHPAFKSKTPNYIYAELPPHVDRDIAWNTFCEVVESGYFCFAIGNDVITGHHEKHSKSGAVAARELQKAEDLSVGFWEIFGNQSYRQQLSPENLLYGPPEFAAVNRDFAISDVESAAEQVGVDSTDAAHYFRASQMVARADLWKHLRTAKVTIDRPWKYWKDDVWVPWFQHVSFASTAT